MNAVASQSSTGTFGWLNNYVWLVKRELWEHRRGFIVTPLIIGAIMIVSAIYGLVHFGNAVDMHFKINGGAPEKMTEPEMRALVRNGIQFALYAPFFIVMSIITGYYALDTLYADRRDRSIFFWKSLPVSDLETILSKLAVVSIVAPLITLAIAVATQLIIFAASSVAFVAAGRSFGTIWTEVPIFDNIAVMLYLTVITALWYLPLWAWCLLASAWAQRAVTLWATIPIGALWYLEYLALGTNHIGHLVRDRFVGMMPLAIESSGRLEAHTGTLSASAHLGDLLTPGTFFASSQLWLGLAAAAGLIAATVWVRRFREPV